jgi:hypothetical protein
MNDKTPFVFILGAADPECSTIEKILIEKKIAYYYAYNNHHRVSSSTAYISNCIRSGKVELPNYYNFEDCIGVFVECSVSDIRSRFKQVIVVDHHRKGDPGFGKPPAEYWLGSSLGQVCNLLNVEATKELKIIAAADHCLGSAYEGLCPDISPVELLNWRVSYRANFKGISEYDLMQRMLDAAVEITNAKRVTIGSESVADFTYYQCPEECSEGSLVAKLPVIYREYDKKVGMYKYKLTGAKRETIELWMQNMQSKLINIYGDPWRGFAGGYIKPTEE